MPDAAWWGRERVRRCAQVTVLRRWKATATIRPALWLKRMCLQKTHSRRSIGISLEGRLSRLEAKLKGPSRCAACSAWPPPEVRVLDAGDPAAAEDTLYTDCPACGWFFSGIHTIVIEKDAGPLAEEAHRCSMQVSPGLPTAQVRKYSPRVSTG